MQWGKGPGDRGFFPRNLVSGIISETTGKGPRDRGFFLLLLLFLLLAACAPAPTPTPSPTPAPTLTAVPTLEPVSDYPTVDALHTAVIPTRDRIDLARRYLGINSLPPTPASAVTRTVGEQQNFWISDSNADVVQSVTAVLRAVGEHIYIWMDSRADVTDELAESLARYFDDSIYNEVRELWGSEPTPGIDGDPRIYGLFAYGLAPGVAGYFASAHLYPQEIQPYSNQHEMIIFNLDSLNDDITGLSVQSLLAHEFQHMIRANVDDNEDTWMDEGFSTFTELYLGYPNELGAIASFLGTPRTQLNAWAETGARTPHYGAAGLYFQYFFERYGRAMIQTLSADPASGISAVENTIGVEASDALLAD
ncbi:MAG: hypothetical protein U0694_26920 [Anaerolineae bacterium]